MHRSAAITLSLVALLLLASAAGAQDRPAAAELLERLDRDAALVLTCRAGLQSVVAFAGTHPALFPPKKPDVGRLMDDAGKEAIRGAWKSFLDYQLALEVTGDLHRHFHLLEEPHRGESFSVGFAAFLARYRFALEFIGLVSADPFLDVLLNEPVGDLGLPAGTFAKLKLRHLNIVRAGGFAAYEALAPLYRDQVPAILAAGIAEDSRRIVEAGGQGVTLTARNALDLIGAAGFAAWFPLQTGISEWMGDTRVRRHDASLLTPAQIRQAAGMLEPGDILLERREWYLSNVGLPGYWPHAALVVGTPEERRRLFDDSETRAWVRREGVASGSLEELLMLRHPEAYAASLEPDPAGHPRRILEAMSEGVVFTSPEHSLDCDSLAVLRPRLGARDKAVAILRGFGYAGRPYDFNFDFATDTALVCTEVVYKSYLPAGPSPGLRLPLTELLGRTTAPANLLAKLVDEECNADAQQLELVLFLDGVERDRTAITSDLRAFRESWKRPKWHIFVQQSAAE